MTGRPSPASRPVTPAALGGAVLAHDYGPRDAASVLAAVGRRVTLRAPLAGTAAMAAELPARTDDGRQVTARYVWHVDDAPVTAAELDRLAAEVPRQGGRALDPGAITAPCPSCGQPTACGWRERDYRTGRWHDVTFPPSRCLDCVAAAMRAALAGESPPARALRAPESAGGIQLPADGADRPPAPAPSAAQGAFPPAPASAPAPERSPDPAPASWAILGRAVALSAAGVLIVDGRPVAEGVTPAGVILYGGRLYVAGRPVADLAA